MDRIAFDVYIERVLVPSLRAGQTVVLDNLSVHKSPRARELIEASGCFLKFLPTYQRIHGFLYSPDLNRGCSRSLKRIRSVWVRVFERRWMMRLERGWRRYLQWMQKAGLIGAGIN